MLLIGKAGAIDPKKSWTLFDRRGLRKGLSVSSGWTALNGKLVRISFRIMIL